MCTMLFGYWPIAETAKNAKDRKEILVNLWAFVASGSKPAIENQKSKTAGAGR